MRVFTLISAVTLLLSSAAAGAAQEPPDLSLASTLAPGTRVRVVSTAAPSVNGVVLAADETTVTLARENGPALKIPTHSIIGMDMNIGHKRRWREGLGIGVLTGVLIGFTATVDPTYCGSYSGNSCSRGEAVASGMVGGGLLGTGIGALIKTDRWAPIVGLGAPTRGTAKGRSVQAGAAIQF
jgi:hypothetical protein